MAKNIEPTLKLISSYLRLKKSENFVIPEYQRGYSWDIAQCDKPMAGYRKLHRIRC